MDMDTALEVFSAAEANLEKLERLWTEMEKMLPSAFGSIIESVSDDAAYKEKSRQFSHILGEMPAIDGYVLNDELPEADGLQSQILDYHELDEPTATMDFEAHLHRQGDLLAAYRFKLSTKRRALIREAVLSSVRRIDEAVGRITSLLSDSPSEAQLLEHREVLLDDVKAIDALLGSTPRPLRWEDLRRHLHFGAAQDFSDILNLDWPAVRPGLERSLYGENEPLPVAVKDLGVIVAGKPSGPVTTVLKWDALDAEAFERLIFNLLDRQQGWENPQWLTHTNAPDRGRDLSVTHALNDPLSGTVRRRVIVACKHWRSKSMSVPDVSTLVAQMAHWSPPRVDLLIIATSGRFTDDAVDWIEKHNQEDRALRIEMWPDSHLERLLAERPALVATFSLK